MEAPTLEIEPADELVFKLSPVEDGAECALTLKQPGTTNDRIAFRVSVAVA
ncbi:MAG: hypothetical protein ACRDL7_03100 [Gaiellaceae bacterium]